VNRAAYVYASARLLFWRVFLAAFMASAEYVAVRWERARRAAVFARHG
jgi:hypothetical protein